jgi:hypothetical protein
VLVVDETGKLREREKIGRGGQSVQRSGRRAGQESGGGRGRCMQVRVGLPFSIETCTCLRNGEPPPCAVAKRASQRTSS